MRFEGVVYRAHHPRWAFQPDSGEGAAIHGGRFNPRGIPALYTSLRLETAWLEAQQGFAFKSQPMTMCAYRVACDDVLDLRDPVTLRDWKIDPAAFGCPWEDLASRKQPVPSWDLARRLMADGVVGVIAPSFAHRAGSADANTVFWKWARTPPHQVTVIDDFNRLPGDDRSWR